MRIRMPRVSFVMKMMMKGSFELRMMMLRESSVWRMRESFVLRMMKMRKA